MPRAKGYKPRHKGARITKAGLKIRQAKAAEKRGKLLSDIRGRKGKPVKGKKVKGAFLGALVSALAPIAVEEIAKRI